MGGDTVRFTEYRGVRIFRGLIVCKSMEMAFWTEQSVCIIVDGRISGVSVRRSSTVTLLCSMKDVFGKSHARTSNIDQWEHKIQILNYGCCIEYSGTSE